MEYKLQSPMVILRNPEQRPSLTDKTESLGRLKVIGIGCPSMAVHLARQQITPDRSQEATLK